MNGKNIFIGFSDKIKRYDELEILKEYIEIINEVMTVSEASKLWQLSEGAIRKAIASNRLKVKRMVATIYFNAIYRNER